MPLNLAIYMKQINSLKKYKFPMNRKFDLLYYLIQKVNPQLNTFPQSKLLAQIVSRVKSFNILKRNNNALLPSTSKNTGGKKTSQLI